MKSLETVRTTLRIMAKMVAGMGINADRLRAGFIPGVFATDVALRMVAEGTPWREAYHEVRDHLERLEREDPDAAVAAKTHEGTTGGIDYAFYRSRVSELRRLNRKRQQEFARRFKALLGRICSR
jgi:argininosuccinate lyase